MVALLDTGLRIGELLALKAKGIDFSHSPRINQTINRALLVVKCPKNKKIRYMSLFTFCERKYDHVRSMLWGEHMGVQYSVVIPSLNRGEQLLLTLSAFEKQTYPKHRYEVVVVDDGSTDNTKEIIENMKTSYRLVYIKLNTTQGRAAARNAGVRKARGRYIIFCDADFLVKPSFISTHNRYHHRYRHSVVSGVPHCWKNIYTLAYPDFNSADWNTMRASLSKTGLWGDQLQHAKITHVITRDDVLNNPHKVKQAVSVFDFDRSLKKQYASTDVAPWLLFVTRCVSVKKKYILEVGGFNEKFKTYGLEDWELGYRLHRHGLNFVSIKHVIGYHQEHPSSLRGADGNPENLKILFQEHGFKRSALNLFAVTPPWANIEVYKNTLRKIRLYSRGNESQRKLVHAMRRRFRLAAKQLARS